MNRKSLVSIAAAWACVCAAPAFAADVFHTPWRSGMLSGGSPAEVCAMYGDERVAFSQGNPDDHNKWVFWDSMSPPSPRTPSPQGCAWIGTCSLVLQAQDGTRWGTPTEIEQCGPECPKGTVWVASVGACKPLVEPEPPETPPPDEDPCAGNPIYPLRGTKREVVDLGLSIGKLDWQLSYDSTGKVPRTGSASATASDDLAVLGELWFSNLHRVVRLRGAAQGALVTRGNGQVVAFAGNGSGTYTAPSGSRDRLVSQAGVGYRYFDADRGAQETYDLQGKLTKISWQAGGRVNFSYSTGATPPDVAPGPDFLIQAQDDNGRSVALRYDAQGRLVQVTSSAAETIAFSYGTNGMLAGITWPDLTVRSFVYEHAYARWAMTGVVDERGIRKSTFTYDNGGRATGTEYAGGVNKHGVTYTAAPQVTVSDVYDPVRQVVVRSHAWAAPQGTMVSSPNGARAMGATSINGRTYMTSQSQPAGSGCAASTSQQSFDAAGELVSRNDFNGLRTCYVNDAARHLETVRVEGLNAAQVCADVTPQNAALPAGSRKISRRWHPDWRIETQIAEPRRLTTRVYNGQPDPLNGNQIATCAPASAQLPDGKPIAVLCKESLQATNDADGHRGFSAALQQGVAARTTSWTYNARGQVLTEDGPRNDVDDVTTYAYYGDTTADHTTGDLKKVTDAVGQVTQYLKYAPQGQVLESQDANGAVTTNTYDLRRRLKSTTLAGQTTSYDYDAAGLLKKLTQPDGSWIGFDYDDAQRQVAVVDHKGNRVDYVLDNSGKRIEEKTKDPGGQLQRQLSRSIDALGRIQQTTGRPTP